MFDKILKIGNNTIIIDFDKPDFFLLGNGQTVRGS